ncbi:MAG: hypothetical protein ACRD0I_10315 [Acidimicrobiales bacterium]
MADDQDPDVVLARWRSDAADLDSASGRARRAEMMRQAAQESDFADLLCDLAEGRFPVVIHTAAGRRHQGIVSIVGADFLEFRSIDNEGRRIVPLAQVISVRRSQTGPIAGLGPHRPTRPQVRLVEVLEDLAQERGRIAACTIGDDSEAVVGTLHSVAADFLVVDLDGPTRTRVYLPLASLAELAVLGSG